MAFTSFPDIAKIIQVSGLLFWNPTNLATEAGWGAKIGYTKVGVKVAPEYKIERNTTEETGEEVTHKFYIGSSPKMLCELRNWDTPMIDILFPGLGATNKIRIPGSILPGADLTSSTYSKPLLFVPDDTDNHPIALFQKASPNIIATAQILFNHSKEAIFPAVFDGLRKTSDVDGIAFIGPLSEAVLR